MEKQTLFTQKPKLAEIDFLRCVAILAVVLIHSTADATVEPSEGSLSQILFYAVNRGSLYAVPLFIMISGMVLFYRYESGWNLRAAAAFYRKRIWSVAVPYLLWMLLYELFYQWLYNGTIDFKLGEFARKLQWADVGYHLYFMIIILQFYLVFPLVMSLIKQWAWLRKHLVTVAVLLHGGFYVYKFYFAELKHGPSLFATYIGYFLIGGFVGLHYDRIRKWGKGRTVGAGAAALLSAGTFIGVILAGRYRHFHYHNNWYEVLLFVYVCTLFLFLLALGRLVYSKPSRIARLITRVGACSFGIYLVHPALLSLIKKHFPAPGPIWEYDLYVLACFVSVFLGALLLAFLYGQGSALLRSAKKRQESAAPSRPADL